MCKMTRRMFNKKLIGVKEHLILNLWLLTHSKNKKNKQSYLVDLKLI